MIIELLYPDTAMMFGDRGNADYLKACLPDAEFVRTSYTDEPYFVKHKPDLIYMGSMSEKTQKKVIECLMPYKEIFRQRIEENVPVLFTNNASEVLFDYIEEEDGTKIPALGLYHLHVKQDLMHRYNCLVKGTYNGMTIVGYRTTFTFAYGDLESHPFIKVVKGTGMNKQSPIEGIHEHNLFATYLLGPFLLLNPDFVQYFLREVLGQKDAKPAYEDTLREAYRRRLAEFNDSHTDFYQ